MKIEIYTDGACSENPGPGGWASIIYREEGETEVLSGCDDYTTNNKMELQAVIEAYRWIMLNKVNNVRCRAEFEVFSDSAYVVNSIVNGWVKKWSENGWKNAKGEQIKNVNQWREWLFLQKLCKEAKVHVAVTKVKGHAGNVLNELADKVAVAEKMKAVQKAKVW